MVHLIKNYFAIPNNMGFTLVIDKGRTDKEGKKFMRQSDTAGIEEVIFFSKEKWWMSVCPEKTWNFPKPSM